MDSMNSVEIQNSSQLQSHCKNNLFRLNTENSTPRSTRENLSHSKLIGIISLLHPGPINQIKIKLLHNHYNEKLVAAFTLSETQLLSRNAKFPRSSHFLGNSYEFRYILSETQGLRLLVCEHKISTFLLYSSSLYMQNRCPSFL